MSSHRLAHLVRAFEGCKNLFCDQRRTRRRFDLSHDSFHRRLGLAGIDTQGRLRIRGVHIEIGVRKRWFHQHDAYVEVPDLVVERFGHALDRVFGAGVDPHERSRQEAQN